VQSTVWKLCEVLEDNSIKIMLEQEVASLIGNVKRKHTFSNSANVSLGDIVISVDNEHSAACCSCLLELNRPSCESNS
jgi:hypothetical protein